MTKVKRVGKVRVVQSALQIVVHSVVHSATRENEQRGRG